MAYDIDIGSTLIARFPGGGRRKPFAMTAALTGGLLAMLSAGFASAASTAPQTGQAVRGASECCPILELRQYTLYPGARDAFIALFERRFIESQEAVGIRVTGMFRDINDPDRVVWLRGFADMPSRLKALTDFYYGPVWAAYREQANPMLYDNDDVLLLHPASPGSGFTIDARQRAAIDAIPDRSQFVVATIYSFSDLVPAAFVEQFDRDVMPLLQRHGANVLGRFVSDKSPNTFARLPVREKDNVFVWVASFADRQAYDRYLDALGRDPRWRGELFAAIRKSLQRPPETLMLQPTPRSLIGH
jgi:hypothetical protein